MDNRCIHSDVSNLRGGIMGLLFAFFGVARVFGGFLRSSYWAILFFSIGFFVLYNYLKSSKFKMDFIGVLFVIYLFVNVLITRPPSVFQPELRFLLFSFLLFIVSPIIQNKNLRVFRLRSLDLMMIIFVIISSISFFCYFLGINWMLNQTTNDDLYDDYSVSEGAGHFGGITNHSMTLGFISGIAVCYMLCRFLTYKRKLSLVPLICCMGSLLFASSRVALGATIIGCLVFIIRNSRSRLGFLKTIILFVVGFIITLPLWVGALSGIVAKQSGRGDLSEMGGRIGQVEARIEEFADHPIIGIGFASVDPQKSHVGESGNIEPGPSWLTVLSMTGIIGMIIVVIYVYNSFSSLKELGKNLPQKALLSALLVFMIVHLFVEGYIFSGGSLQCSILWLIIGVSRDSKYLQDNI